MRRSLIWDWLVFSFCKKINELKIIDFDLNLIDFLKNRPIKKRSSENSILPTSGWWTLLIWKETTTEPWFWLDRSSVAVPEMDDLFDDLFLIDWLIDFFEKNEKIIDLGLIAVFFWKKINELKIIDLILIDWSTLGWLIGCWKTHKINDLHIPEYYVYKNFPPL